MCEWARRTYSNQKGHKKKLVEDSPPIPLTDESRQIFDWEAERQYNALISFYLHIPFPERLSDEEWIEKKQQIDFLAASKLLGIQFK